MTRQRIFMFYEEKGADFATQLMSDLRNAGAEVITDHTDLHDAAFEQFLSKELPRCQQLIVVQTPEALQSLRVQRVVEMALKYVQEGQMAGLLRVTAPTLDAIEVQEVPFMWATIPEFDASQDYPRALAKLSLHWGLIGINDISNDLPAPASYMPPVGPSDLRGTENHFPTSGLFPPQRTGSLDRPVRPPRHLLQFRTKRFILFSLAMVLIVVIAGGAVFIARALNPDKPPLAVTGPLIATPTTTHIPTATPTPMPTPTIIPTAPATPSQVLPPGCGGAFSDEFNSTLQASWIWVDPTAHATYNVTPQGLLTISTIDNKSDLNPITNTNAPRLLQSIVGNFTIQTSVTLPVGQQAGFQAAGLLVWQDKSNFIRVERYFNSIDFEQFVNGVYTRGAPTSLVSSTITGSQFDLQLQRSGDLFTASWREPGQGWQVISTANVHLQSTKVGLDLISQGAPQTIAYYDYFRVSCI